MRLAGKVALITGAAAGLQGEVMGFGGATSWLFAREGAKVVLTDVDEDTGQKTASQIRQGGWEALFVRLDVTSEQDWTDAVSTTIAKYGRLDILFNNAGGGPGHALEETPVEDWDRVMDLNAKGVFLGTKHAVPEMRKVGGGSIINMSSVHGIAGTPRSVAYSAAKGAIRNFTKAAALGYAKEGIRVNSIHPRQLPDGEGGEAISGRQRARAYVVQYTDEAARHGGRDSARGAVPGIRRVVLHHRRGTRRRRRLPGGVGVPVPSIAIEAAC